MAIDAIGRVDSQAALGVQQSAVNIDDFLKLFLTQLNFQDPLKPVDNREFIAQLASFSALEIQSRNNENLGKLLDTSSVDQSIGLLGKTVQVNTPDAAIIGQVTTVRLAGDNLLLTVLTSTGDSIEAKPSNISLIR